MNRRKLGSSRKSKGRQHVKEAETEQELEPRKDVQEETWGIATLQTQVSATTQLEIQKESGQRSEDASAKCVTSLVSAPAHESENESTAMSSSEANVEIVVSKDSDVQDFKGETTLKETNKSIIAQNEETKDGLLEMTSGSTCLSVDQQMINIEEECSNMYFVAESDDNTKADTDLFSQDESFQGKFSASESHVEIVSESTTPEKPVDNATDKVNREIKTVEQEVIVLPKEELATNKGKSNVFKQPKIRDVQYPGGAVTKMDYKDNMSTEACSMDQTDEYPGSLKLQLLEDSELCFKNIIQSDLNLASDPQIQVKSPSTDGQTDANFSFIGGRRKLGSSRRNKGRQHVEESEEKVTESTKGDEVLETLTISLQIQTGNPKELTQNTEQKNFLSVSQDSSMSSMYLPGDEPLVHGSVSTKYTKTDPQSFISKCENLNEAGVDFKQVMLKNSEGITQQEVNESHTLQSEVTKAFISEGPLREMQESEIHPVQTQENLQTDHLTGTVDAVETCEMVCKNLTHYAEMSELTVGNNQSTIKHDVYPTKEDVTEDSDLEDERQEKYLTEEKAPKYEIKSTTYQTFYQEKEVEGDKSKLSTLQSENVFVDAQPQNDPKTVEEQINTSSDKKGKRKRLGSKRRKRLRSLNESKQDLFENTKANEVPETSPTSLETTVRQKALNQDTDHDINQTMSHDSSVNLTPSPDHSAEIHIFGAKEYPECDLESFKVKSEKAPETDNNVEMFDKPRDTAPVDESKEMISPHGSEGQQLILADQAIEVQESLQIDNAFVTDNAPENIESVTGILIDQTEPVITYQSGLTKKSTDDFVTNQKVAVSDDKAIMFFTVKGNAKALVQRYEHNLVNEPDQMQINKTESKDAALVQTHEDESLMEVDIAYSSECGVHQEGSISELDQAQQSNLNPPSDNQLQDESLSTDEQTKTNFSFNCGRRQDSEPRKDVQEEPRDIKTLQTQVSKAIQPEIQDEPLQKSEYGLPAKHTSLVLATMHDYSAVKDSMPVSCSKEVIEITVRKDNNMVKDTNKNSIAQNVEIPESTRLSELTKLSACLVDEQIIKQEGIFNTDVEAQSESNKKADSDLFLGNYSVKKLHVKTCSETTTSETTTDNSTNKDRQIRHSIEQKAILLPNVELATNEEKGKLFKLPNMRDGQYPEGAVNKVDNKVHMPTKVHGVDQADDSAESLKLPVANDSDLFFDSLMLKINTYQPENKVKSADHSATKHADSALDGKLWSAREEKTVAFEVQKDDYVHKTKQTWTNKSYEVNVAVSQTFEGGRPAENVFAGQSFHDEKVISEAERTDICDQSPLLDSNDPSEPQLQDKSLSKDEKTGTNFRCSGNPRKLGSRRGRKGRQHVRDSEIEQDQEPRINVQEKTRSVKTLQTQASEATQLEMQEGDESENSTSAECVTSLVLDAAHGFSEVKEWTQISKDDNVTRCKDEHNLDETDKSNIAQNVDSKQNMQACFFELASFSACPPSDQQSINKHEEILNVYVSEELESNKNADTDLFSQDESFQGNYSGSESHVKTDSELTTPKITADNSTNIVNREIKDGIEQAVILLPNKELAANKEKGPFFNLPNIRDGQYLQDAVDKVDNGGNKLHLLSTGEEKLVEEVIEHFTEQSDNLEGVLFEAESNNVSVQSLLSDIKAPLDSQLQEKSLSTDEQTDVDFSFKGSRRKLGSSRKNKRKQLGNNFKEEGIKNAMGNEVLEDPKIQSKPDAQSSVLQSKGLQKDEHEGEKYSSFEIVEQSVDDTKEDEDKSDLSYSEDKKNILSDDSQIEAQEVEVHSIQMSESLQTGFSLQTITGDETQSSEVVSGPLTDLSEISKITIKTTYDENEEYQTEENISEASDLKHDNSDLCDFNKQVEKVKSAVSQVYEFKNRVVDDTEPKAKKICHQEKSDFDRKEGKDSEPTTLQSETVSFDSEFQKDSENVDEQTNTGFSISVNRKKLKSSLRNKRRQRVIEGKGDIVLKNEADETPKTTQMSLERRASQEQKKQDIECEINLPVSLHSSMFAVFTPGQYSDVHSTVTQSHPETDLDSFVTKSESSPEKTHEKETDIKSEMSDKFKEATPVIATGQEQVLKEKTTQILEDLQIDYSSDTMADEAPFNPEILIGRLNEQIEIFNKNFIEKRADDSANIQEVSSSDDKHIMLSTVGDSLEVVIHRNEADHRPEQTLITDTESQVASLSQADEGEAPLEEDIKDRAEQNVNLGGVSSEAERNVVFVQSPLTDLKAPTDFQLQDRSLSTEEQTDANLSFSGSKRKLGSSRRSKGRHRGKESKDDVSEYNKGDEVIETLKVSLEIKPARIEEMSQDIKHDNNLSASYDTSTSLMPLPGHSSVAQSSEPTPHPESNPQSSTRKSDNHQKHQQETEINMGKDEPLVDDTKEGLDQSKTCHSEDLRNVQSADVQLKMQEDEVLPTQMHKCLQMKSSSETLVDNESWEVVSGLLIDQEEISDLAIKRTADPETTQTAQEETLNQEELKQDIKREINLLVSHDDSSMFAVVTPGQSSEVHSTVTQSRLEPGLEKLVPKNKSPQEHRCEFETDNKLELSDKSGKATAVNKPDSLLSQDVMSPHGSVIATGQEQVLEEQTKQKQKSLQVEYSSDTMTNKAPINPEILIAGFNEETETVNTEFTEKITGDSANIQEVSSSDDKQIMLSTVGDSLEVVIHRNEADHIHRPEQTLITDTESQVASLSQADEGEAPLEEDIKDRAEQNVNLERVSSEAERNVDFVQSPLTDLKAPTDFQLQDRSLSTEEQTDANLSFSGSKRKLGSSRRNKGKYCGKESKDDASKNTKGDEVLETTQALEMKTSDQDNMSQNIEQDFILSVSLASTKSIISPPGYSSEIQSSLPTTHPEIDPVMLIPKSEHFQDHNVRKTEIKGGLVKQSMDTKQDVNKFDTLHSEGTGNVLFDDAPLEAQVVKVHPAQMPESLQIDISLQTVTGDGTESCEVVSEPLTDLTEISELTMITTDDSTKKQQDHTSSEENISEVSDLKHDNSDSFSMIKQQISEIKEAESSECLVKESNNRVEDDIKLKAQLVFDQENEGLLIDTEEKKSAALSSETVSFDSRPQNESITVGDQTNSDFSRSGNKTKLGSSRRTKGRQQIKEFKEEVLENTKDDAALETTVLLDIKTTEQKELTQDIKHDYLLSVSQDSSMSLMPSPDHSFEVQSSKATKYPETKTQTFILGSQNLNKGITEREPDINVEIIEESVRPTQQEIVTFGAFHIADLIGKAQGEVQKVESHPTQMQGSQQIVSSSDSFKGYTTKNTKIISGNVKDPANISEQKEYFTKENEISDSCNANKPQISDLEMVDSALRQAHEFKDKVEDDINLKSEQIFHQEEAGFSSAVGENKLVLSTLQSESVSFDSQPQNDSLSVHEQTNMEFHNSGSRRKLGSSRRTKGRQTVKDSVTETYKRPIEDDEEKGGGNTLSETTLTVESTGQKEGNLHTGAFGWTSDVTSVGVHSTTKADEKFIDKPLIPDEDLSSESTELLTLGRCSEENLFVSEPEVCLVTSERNTDKSFIREETDPEDHIKKTPKSNKYLQHTEDEKQTDNLVEKTKIKSSDIFYSTQSKENEADTEMLVCLSDLGVSATPERTTEKSSSTEHTEGKHSVEQEAFLSPHDHLPTNEEQGESNKIYKITETLLSEDIGIKEHEDEIDSEQMQDMHHIDSISLPQNTSSVQTLQPDASVASDSDSQGNYQSNKVEAHSGLKAAGSRRKMGSSRRIKGRQNGKFTEVNQEHEEEDVDNTENDEATQMSTTKTITQRASKDFKSVEKFEAVNLTEDKKVKKDLEEKVFFSQEDQNNKTVSTSNIFTSSNKEDNNSKSSEDTKEKHVKLAHEPDDLSQLPGCDTDKKSLIMQSAEASVSKGASDMERIVHHDDIIISEPGSVSVPEQDGAIQHQSREAETLEPHVQLQQTNKVTETVGCVASEASSTNVQDPELHEVREKRVCADREIESISASEEPPVSETSTTMDVGNSQQGKTSSDFSESFEAKSKQKKKFGSSRRTQVSRNQEGETHKDETNMESNAEDGMKVVEELPSTAEGRESENVQPSLGDLVQREPNEAKTSRSDEHRHVQETKEQKTENTSERIHSQTVVVKSESPDFSSTNRRRKMGSTRRNLGSRNQEHMDQEEELETETTGGNATSEKVSEIQEEKLHVQAESNKRDSDQRKENVFETAAISHVGEALLKPVAEETPEERPASPSQDDSMSEPASGGRRKKFGSNRRTHLQQRNRDQKESEVGLIDAQNENDAGGTREEGPDKAAEQPTDKSSGVETITEVDKNGHEVSANVSISEAKVAVSEATPRKLHLDKNRSAQESEGQLSFGTNTSNIYNVVLVGESCVGKSSFMKRALSGKFALDIPSSVGLDSCKWTVVVDGKPVLLQLWDTAGQERFHSITRHIFHKAQAFLLMYDITSSQSFSAVSYWANTIQESALENVTVLLLGNKSDHTDRQVKTEQGDILAKEYNYGFMECSAATGENVIEALETVARMLNQNSDIRGEDSVLQKQAAPKSQSRCC